MTSKSLLLPVFIFYSLAASCQMTNLLDSLSYLSRIEPVDIGYKKKAVEDNLYTNSPLGPQANILRARTYTCSDKVMKGLWVKHQEKLFQYKNQNLFLKENSREPAQTSQLHKDVARVLRYLKKLEKKSDYARNIIHDLQQSENQFTISIVETTASYMVLPLPNGRHGILNNNAYAFQCIEKNHLLVDYADFDQIGSGADIRLSTHADHLTLAHELSHAYDANYGLMDDRLTKIKGMTMSVREIRALFHENMIRKEMNKGYRKKAGSGHALISEGKPYTHPIPFRARH